MQVEILDFEKPETSAGEKVTFAIRNCDNAFANGLRRVILSEIPTLAIDVVTVISNTSVFFDEFIVHRLGMIPVLSELVDELVYPRDCACGGEVGCSACQIGGRLTVACSSKEHKRDVYASDMVFDHPSIRHVSYNDRGVWIMSLGRSQEIDVQFYIRKGIAKEHTKWMAVGTVSMQFEMAVKVFQNSFRQLPDASLRKTFVDRCPGKVFAYDEVEQLVTAPNPERCIYCRECISIEPPFNNLPEPLVNVRPRINENGKYNFIFTVESLGTLPVLTVILKAVDVYIAKMAKVKTVLLADGGVAGDADGAAAPLPTRPIGTAPTAVRIVDQDLLARNAAEHNEDDNLQRFNFV